MIDLAAAETVGLGAIIGLLSGALTLLGLIFRYLRKGWGAIEMVLHKIDDTAYRVSALEEQVKNMNEKGTTVSQEIRRKLETGEAKAQSVNPQGQPR